MTVYLDQQFASQYPRERFNLQRQLVAGLAPAIPVDLVVLNEAPPLLGHRALGGNALLMRNRTAYVRYFVRTVGAALDQAPMMKFHADARRRRLQERGVG